LDTVRERLLEEMGMTQLVGKDPTFLRAIEQVPQFARSEMRVLITGETGTPAWAVDGVVDINQARAKAGGVTPGDAPLFPVTINQPGSYRLTGNLDVTDAGARPGGTAAENTTAIKVTAMNVTIDLNGFTILGPAVCSGVPTSCTLIGTGEGIDAFSANNVNVLNGTIQGMGIRGITLNSGRVDGVTAQNNGGFGIQANSNSRSS
jgi:hypothetical protein